MPPLRPLGHGVEQLSRLDPYNYWLNDGAE
jgi:hypothetical protein